MYLSYWACNSKGDPTPCWGTAEQLVINQCLRLCGGQNVCAMVFSNPLPFSCPIFGKLIVHKVLQELKHYHG